MKMLRHSTPTFLLVFAVTGCADISGPPQISPRPADVPLLSWDGVSINRYNTIAEAQADMGAAVVHSTTAAVAWNGSTANSAMGMRYRGTDAEIIGTLSGGGPSGSFSTTSRRRNETGGLDANFLATGPRYTVGGSCGHVANLNTENIARIRVPVPWELREIAEDSAPGHDSAEQPACAFRDETVGGGGGGGCDGRTSCEDEYPTGEVCVIRYWYDMYTGVILDAELLYCY